MPFVTLISVLIGLCIQNILHFKRGDKVKGWEDYSYSNDRISHARRDMAVFIKCCGHRSVYFFTKRK